MLSIMPRQRAGEKGVMFKLVKFCRRLLITQFLATEALGKNTLANRR